MSIFSIRPKGRIQEFLEGRRSVTKGRDWSRIAIGLDLGNKGSLALGPVSRKSR